MSEPDAPTFIHAHPGTFMEYLLQSGISMERAADDILQMPREELALWLGQMRQRLRSSSTFLSVASHLTGTVDLTELIQAIVFKISEDLKADRATLFLVDPNSGELWSKVAQGLEVAEIRVPAGAGIVGHVATSGKALNIPDVYQHELFNPEIDKRTGYKTRSMLCYPIRNPEGRVIGVLQVINRAGGPFTVDDESTLRDLAVVLALTLENALLYDQTLRQRRQVESLLRVAGALSAQLDLDTLIQTIMAKACEIMDADRATLFLLDRDTNELWSKVAQGLDVAEIRFPADKGIAGHVATSGETLNIQDAYESDLFNPEIDKKTGYRTKTILCMPIRASDGKVMGVTQVINKSTGIFTKEDEDLLAAFSSQGAIALENAQLYESVLNLKNYLESILENLTNGVLTVDSKSRITTANQAARNIFELPELVEQRPAAEVFGQHSPALPEKVAAVLESHKRIDEYDADYETAQGNPVSLNLTVQPLADQTDGRSLGAVMIMEDLTKEKRTRSMMTRLVSREIADQLLGEDFAAVMQGRRLDVSVLFSDIRSYTSLTEKSDAHEIVAMLNDYFTYMVDAIFEHGGTIDKFIGDALMAIFGAPVTQPDHAFRAVRAALEMQRQLAVFNANRAAMGQQEIKIGLGISSGEVLCGTIGSEKKMEYTAIGDGVNLASRLEGATKQYGIGMMISGFTRDACADKIIAREIDYVKVKGKNKPVTVYEPFALTGDSLPESVERMLPIYQAGLEAIHAREFGKARDSFLEVLKLMPDDKPSRMWAERATRFEVSPPPDDWDGSFRLTEK